MTTTNDTLEAAWRALQEHAKTLRAEHLRDLFAEDPRRFADFSLKNGDILMDFSKQRLTVATLRLLRQIAQASDFACWRQRMAAGETINHTENRAVVHMALRAPIHAAPDATTGREVAENLDRMRIFCAALHAQPKGGERVTDVIHLGIGGSDLGPRMAVQALAACQHPDLRIHFAANVDGAALAPLLARLNPRSTLFIIVSKTFTTQETLTNARTAREWIEATLPEKTARADADAVARHFVAVTGNRAAATAFGIPASRVFLFADGVGGRFSLWSPVGLSIALAIGFSGFSALLSGARQMDEHFLSAPEKENLPLTLALIDLWNVNALGACSRGVFPYSQSLELFPAYLQQLEMESLGKSVDRQGAPLTRERSPILWGAVGTNGQHAVFQFLHQGGRFVPCDFILLKHADFPLPDHHLRLLANGLAQSAALAFGETKAEAHARQGGATPSPWRDFPGNQPSTTLLLERLTPHVLGQLLALYEHKVFCLGVLWQLNAFDQWGVELGKQMAERLLPCLEAPEETPGASALDASTLGLIAALKAERLP
ncbi:MAG: glucose-6-phosphate isomerase [Zoogloeaceae bacterium]|jgi:glucose-6-phosphate isomerase|nr:glucose-6-phosphate isomerase [Zoogloeaceae bacterium]